MKTSSLCCLLLGLVFTSPGPLTQVDAQAPADAAAYAVAYVEVAPSASQALIGALTTYRDASRTESGYVTVDLLEQVGRPGHFAVVEEWANQRAIEAHAAAEHVTRFHDRIQPLRSSGYDERPYKPFSVASPTGVGDAQGRCPDSC